MLNCSVSCLSLKHIYSNSMVFYAAFLSADLDLKVSHILMSDLFLISRMLWNHHNHHHYHHIEQLSTGSATLNESSREALQSVSEISFALLPQFEVCTHLPAFSYIWIKQEVSVICKSYALQRPYTMYICKAWCIKLFFFSCHSIICVPLNLSNSVFHIFGCSIFAPNQN